MNTHSYIVFRIMIVPLMSVLLTGCGGDPPQDSNSEEQYSRQAIQKDYSNLPKSEEAIVKVKVLSDGEILLDDKTVSIDELRLALQMTRKDAGAVWYYRESASEDSSDERMAVMDIITDEGLPTKFSTKPDFSNSVPPFEDWK